MVDWLWQKRWCIRARTGPIMLCCAGRAPVNLPVARLNLGFKAKNQAQAHIIIQLLAASISGHVSFGGHAR